MFLFYFEGYISVQSKDFKKKKRPHQRALGEMLKNTEAFESKVSIAEQAVHFGFQWNHFQEHRPSEFIKQKLEFQKYGL